MEYAYRLFKNVQFFYSTLNPASLSGAIDLIVVEQPDGTYRSTPFHVRFGKYGVFNSNEKYVDITINGEEIDLKMKLGENGVAFFVEKADNEDVPEYLATSPIPGESSEPDVDALLEASAVELRNQQRGRSEQKRIVSESSSISRSPSPLSQQEISSGRNGELLKVEDTIKQKPLPFSALLCNGRHNRSLPNLSDLQGKISKHKDSTVRKTSDNSSAKMKRSITVDKGRSSSPPSVAARRKIFEQYWKNGELKKKKSNVVGGNRESDNEDVASSTSSLASSGLSSLGEDGSHIAADRSVIADGAVSDSEVDRQRIALPLHGSDVTEWNWGELPKTRDQTESAKNKNEEKTEAATKESKSSWSGWFRWSRPKPSEDQGIYLDDLVESSARDPGKIEMYLGTPISSCPSPPYDSGNVSTTSPSFGSYNESEFVGQESFSASETSVIINEKSDASTPVADCKSSDILQLATSSTSDLKTDSSQKGMEHSSRSKSPSAEVFQMSEDEADATVISEAEPDEKKPVYIRSLRLSSEKLKKLGLRRGANEARFSITTKFQGTCLCSCHIYLYKWYDQLVISDIDGTITKSDVLGHVIPAIGGQWAHAGVAELYTRIKENGYKLVYLSSRAVGQSYYTKKYLQSIAQDSQVLPDGPLLLSPTSVLMAFRREVIDRKPEEFKIAALSDLKECFPIKKPFYAGFGNRDTDVISYRAVDIPPERIMIIDKTGRVRRADEIGYESSYVSIAMETADYIFPPLMRRRKDKVTALKNLESVVSLHMKYSFPKPQTCSSFTYWRMDPSTAFREADFESYEKERITMSAENKKKRRK